MSPKQKAGEKQFHIRKAAARDAEAILSCLAAAFAAYREQYTPAGFADTVLTKSSIQEHLRKMCVLVAVSEGEVIGTIGCKVTGKEGHLRRMAVVPSWQGTNTASALVQAAETELRNHQCKFITLDTTEPLKRAIRFYQKCGFSASGRVSDFFGMPLYEYVKSL
jgi:GNAT superfamily N-acetyltransferase